MKKIHELCKKYDHLFLKAGLIEAHECAADVIGKRIVVLAVVRGNYPTDPASKETTEEPDSEKMLAGTVLSFNVQLLGYPALIYFEASMYLIESVSRREPPGNFGTDFDDLVEFAAEHAEYIPASPARGTRLRVSIEEDGAVGWTFPYNFVQHEYLRITDVAIG